ncbi:MAG: radical SAM protein [Candidatus Caenarcaniphilales bacterium]|nr:radical SAM protein [Candidatus Caenarcaniphilales bacterium]
MSENFLKERMKDSSVVSAESLILKPPFPYNMLVELSNYCNHSCVFCTNPQMQRKIGFLDFQLLKNILIEAYTNGTREIGLYRTGEPFAFGQLNEVISMARDIGFEYIYITTNGSLATPEKLIQAIESGLNSIKFSVNAATRETYKMIHGSDDFEQVMSNIKFLKEYRDSNNLNLKIGSSFVTTSETEHEVSIYESIFKDLVDSYVTVKAHNQGGNMTEYTSFNTISAPCHIPFNRLHISCEGYLTMCCADFENYLVVADLKEVTLTEAWHSEKAQDLRRKHIENKLEGTLCYNCITGLNTKISPL